MGYKVVIEGKLRAINGIFIDQAHGTLMEVPVTMVMITA